MQRWTFLAAVSLSIFSVLVPARADFTVSIGNQTVPVGGAGYVDVMVSSNSPGGDLLNAFNFDFRIGSAGQTRMEFMGTQPDLQLTDPNYVFLEDSFDHDDPLNQFPMPVGTVSSLSEPNNRFVGGDSAADLSDMLITATPKLLARLEVNASTGLLPSAGDTFTVSLDTAGSFSSTATFSIRRRCRLAAVQGQSRSIRFPSRVPWLRWVLDLSPCSAFGPSMRGGAASDFSWGVAAFRKTQMFGESSSAGRQISDSPIGSLALLPRPLPGPGRLVVTKLAPARCPTGKVPEIFPASHSAHGPSAPTAMVAQTRGVERSV